MYSQGLVSKLPYALIGNSFLGGIKGVESAGFRVHNSVIYANNTINPGTYTINGTYITS